MSISVFSGFTLGTSEVYQTIKELTNSDPTQRAISLINTVKPLRKEDIEHAYVQLIQYSNTLSRAVVRSFDEGTIVLLYNGNKSMSVTTALPYITFNKAGKYVTYVFLDNYAKYSRDGILQIQFAPLHDLMTGALIANRLKTNHVAMTSNQFLQRIFMEIYTKLVCRVLNRDFSIAPERVLFETVQYWTNRFFLTRIFGSQDSPVNIETTSRRDVKNIDEMRMNEIKYIYDEANPLKLSELFELIKTLSPRMKSLTLGSFVSNWISYYYPISTLAVDNIEYFIFMVLSLFHGNNIINISASEIVKETKNIKSLPNELFKII